MKKGFISALFVSLLIATPSIVQAQENGKPLLSIGLSDILIDSVQDLESQIVEPDNEVQAAGVPISSSSNANDDSQSYKEDSGLLNVGLGLPVIGEVNVDLLAGGKAESSSDNTTSSEKSLLGLEIKDSELLGDVNLEVLKENQQGNNKASAGLVSVDVDNQLLGQTHVGVLEGNQSGSSDTTKISGGLLVVESQSSVLGDTHIGVGEISKSKSQLPVIKLANFSDDLIANTNSSTNNQFNGAGKHNPSNLPSTQSNHTGSIVNDGGLALVNGGKAGELYLNGSENNDNQSNSIRQNVLAVANFIDAGNSTVLNQQTENDLDELKKIINQVNESETNTIKLVASSSVAPSNGSISGASAGGTANSGGVTGIAAYMALDYYNDVELSSQVTNRSDKISDQWLKSPPNDPPKSTFFLKV